MEKKFFFSKKFPCALTIGSTDVNRERWAFSSINQSGTYCHHAHGDRGAGVTFHIQPGLESEVETSPESPGLGQSPASEVRGLNENHVDPELLRCAHCYSSSVFKNTQNSKGEMYWFIIHRKKLGWPWKHWHLDGITNFNFSALRRIWFCSDHALTGKKIT